MLKLYTDKNQTFECIIEIENADLNNARARLLLEGKQLDYVFEGDIDSDGNCKINLPPLKLLNSKNGSAILEVIVEGGYFDPLITTYELINRKVTVENVTMTDKSQSEVIVKVKEITKPTYKFLKSKYNDNDINLITEILNEYNNLNEQEKHELTEHIKLKYKPNKKTFKWAEQIFENVNSVVANIIMYKIDNS